MCTSCDRVCLSRLFNHELISKEKKIDVELQRKRYLRVLVNFLKKYVRLMVFVVSSYLGVNYLFVCCVLLKCVAYFIIFSHFNINKEHSLKKVGKKMPN